MHAAAAFYLDHGILEQMTVEVVGLFEKNRNEMGKMLTKNIYSLLLLLLYDYFLLFSLCPLIFLSLCLWSSGKFNLIFAYNCHFEIILAVQCFSGMETT